MGFGMYTKAHYEDAAEMSKAKAVMTIYVSWG